LLSAEGEVLGQSDQWARFVFIVYTYNSNRREFQFVFSGRLYSITSSYICQLQQQGLSKIRVHTLSTLKFCAYTSDVVLTILTV